MGGSNMIYINRPLNLKKIKYILCDFDRTTSLSNSPTSWGLFSLSKKVPSRFTDETYELYDKYRVIEVNHDLSIDIKKKYMTIWPVEQVLLFPKYGIDYEQYMEICQYENAIQLRKDFPAFVHSMYEQNIPVYIISAGLYEPIECILKMNDALLPNVTIISNHIKHDHGIITGIDGPIINSMNKDEIICIDSSEHGLLFGDLPSDKLMATGLSTTNVGFLGSHEELPIFNQEFDITLTGESSFTNVSKILIKK